jgi:hypothetical protein
MIEHCSSAAMIQSAGGAFSLNRRCIGPTGSIDLTETPVGKLVAVELAGAAHENAHRWAFSMALASLDENRTYTPPTVCDRRMAAWLLPVAERPCDAAAG